VASKADPKILFSTKSSLGRLDFSLININFNDSIVFQNLEGGGEEILIFLILNFFKLNFFETINIALLQEKYYSVFCYEEIKFFLIIFINLNFLSNDFQKNIILQSYVN
jgi:hypothetical protein